MPAEPSAAKLAYTAVQPVLEEALAVAARSQWAGAHPDLRSFRRTLIDARRSVPNDRLDPEAQVVRDLLTAYVTLLDEQAAVDSYQRDRAVSEELRSELGRLRPRAARHGLAVLDDRLAAFRVGRPQDVPARAPRPPETPPPSAPPRSAGAPARRRSRRPRATGR